MRPIVKQAVIDALTMAIVAGLSLFLLLYVAHGEAQRTYQQFQAGKLTAQGAVIQKTIEGFLAPGLPMKQFVGFKAITDRALASDRNIAAIGAFDMAGRPVFQNGVIEVSMLRESARTSDSAGVVRESAEFIQVVLPLRNKFEQVGSLAISMPRSIVAARVDDAFRALLPMLAAVVAAFSLFVAIGAPLLSGRHRRWLQLGFAMTFIAMSIAVVSTLVVLYSDGAQAKTRALANSLGQRLASIVQAGVNVSEIQGLDQLFSDYLRLNPDINSAGVIVDGRIMIHTDAASVGTNWTSNPLTYEFFVDLTRPGGRKIEVIVEMEINLVYRQILRSVKNFAALFVASAFLAGLFLQLAGQVRRRAPSAQFATALAGDGIADGRANVNLVKPVFFLAVFIEHLTYAFLPQFMHRLSDDAGLSSRTAALLFMSYFLAFALSLVPAGHLAQRRGTRLLMVLGLLLAAAGFIAMMWRPDFYAVLGARALSGVGQGMLFIGVQSYVLVAAAPDRRTRGAGVIVFAYQGGMISGMAIGSLLVSQIGPAGVFAIGAAVAGVMIAYTLAVVPALFGRGGCDAPAGFGALLRGLGAVLTNGEFLRTMMLIGVPAKAVLTGVIVFALPLLMDQARFAQEDIGQILMVYAGAVIISSAYVSRQVDRHGRTDGTLVLGAVLSGLGLMIIAMMGGSHLAGGISGTMMLIVGVCIVGIAHGFINAPVVTRVASSSLAATLGESTVTATYRFLERAGHITGPVLVGQLFLIADRNPSVIAWIGGAVILCGIVFHVQSTFRSILASREVT